MFINKSIIQYLFVMLTLEWPIVVMCNMYIVSFINIAIIDDIIINFLLYISIFIINFKDFCIKIVLFMLYIDGLL